MEIILDKKSNTEGLIKIKVTEGDYQPHVEEKVKDYAKKANIKGFRPGKVPSGVIRKMFGKSILVDEINHLLSHKLSDYIKDNNLKILGDPLPNHDKARDIDWDSQKNFEFEYEIGMVDEFKYDLSPKVKVKSYLIEVDKKTLDETIADLTKRFGEVSYPDVSEADDTLVGTLTEQTAGLPEGETGFVNEQATIAISQVSKKEQKKFAGLKKDDEVEFEIGKLFSDELDVARLLRVTPDEAKEQKGAYRFKVGTISRTTPAALDQAFFDQVFGKDAVKTEEEFIARVKETVAENYKRETEHFLDHTIEDHFIENTKINLPENFLKQWLKNSGEGQITDHVLENEFESYKRGLVWDLIKNRIAEDHKITVEADEVKNRAKELIAAQFGGAAVAEQLGDRLDAFAENYLSAENGQNFMKLYQQLRTGKILGLIRENITISEKKVDVEEFKKLVASHKH